MLGGWRRNEFLVDNIREPERGGLNGVGSAGDELVEVAIGDSLTFV